MSRPTLKDRVLTLVTEVPGLTDREIADRLLGRPEPPQGVNQVARQLAAAGALTRSERADGLIGNYPVRMPATRRLDPAKSDVAPRPTAPSPTAGMALRRSPPEPGGTGGAVRRSLDVGGAVVAVGAQSPAAQVHVWPAEDCLKRHVKDYLENDGWRVTVMWGKDRGVDVEAFKGAQRWLFEVKGRGGSQQVNATYFISMLGETLQRMSDPNALYTIVMPDIPQFRGLWKRLPALAKERTAISAMFVAEDGAIDHQ